MKLVNPTDDELNAAFAVSVCGRTHVPALTDPENPHYGYREHWEKAGEELWFRDNQDRGTQMPNFVASADAVLPWLEKSVTAVRRSLETGKQWEVMAWGDDMVTQYWFDDSLPRAAVIALLRAHGVELIFQ